MSELVDRQFERILIVKPSSLGDIIHALPVLTGLRRRYCNAHIAWLAATPYVELLRAQPGLDDVIAFDRHLYGTLWRSLSALKGFAEFVRKLRRERFDLVVDLQGLFRSGLFARITGAPVRIGLADGREMAWLFHTHRAGAGDGDSHAVEKNYLAAAMLGLGEVPGAFNLQAPPESVQAAAALLGDDARGYVVLAPGARSETKVWPATQMAELAGCIDRQLGLRVVLIGAPGDAELCRLVQGIASSEVLNTAGRTSLTEMVAILAGATAVVCNDSGPLHIASALTRPVVALFGPTNPARTGPYNTPSRVIQQPLACVPCYFRRAHQCPYDLRCMREITVERVLSELEAVLEVGKSADQGQSDADRQA